MFPLTRVPFWYWFFGPQPHNEMDVFVLDGGYHTETAVSQAQAYEGCLGGFPSGPWFSKAFADLTFLVCSCWSILRHGPKGDQLCISGVPKGQLSTWICQGPPFGDRIGHYIIPYPKNWKPKIPQLRKFGLGILGPLGLICFGDDAKSSGTYVSGLGGVGADDLSGKLHDMD